MKKFHFNNLEGWLREYANDNALTFHKYNEYHMRLMDGGLVCLDTWTTGRYYIKETNYNLLEAGLVERAGQKGTLHVQDKKKLFKFLDKLFFPLDA